MVEDIYKIDSIGRRYKANKNFTKKSISFRFWKWVERGPDNECWNWKGNIDRLGYGRIDDNDNKTQLAHRISMKLHGYSLPDDKCVLHTCDNPSCVNPNHLIIGTKHDNNTDMAVKNRSAMGEKNGQAKLTLQEVTEIIMLSRDRSIKRISIAAKYNIAISTYYSIVRGLRWNKILNLQ